MNRRIKIEFWLSPRIRGAQTEGDYIHDVFDDWLAERAGEFTAALIDDQVVAIAKLSDLGDGEWWFEGLRVDPDFRRRGIAAALNRYHVAIWRGDWVARSFAT